MTIRVALNHRTTYRYDRLVSLGPQTIRLRPAPHCRTPISSYSLKISPKDHFVNWQQDPYGNFLARCVFPERVRALQVEVDLIAEMTVINPFDFFLDAAAEEFPFAYGPALLEDLRPFLKADPVGPRLAQWLKGVDRAPRRTIDFLVDVNRRLEADIDYLIRMEPGVQSCEETLERGSGSCRDSAWLMVQILRNLGLAARFTSGYLLQLKPDVASLDGPSGPAQDFTDLHAWTEVFLPGAGWIGLDPTSGLLAGEGHVPLACTPCPISAAPITGTVDESEAEFDFAMTITRVHEDPRVTKPYSDPQWERILALGDEVDRQLEQGDVRLTMGGEPTFVSIDDQQSEEWQTAALGPTKRKLANQLMLKLKRRFAPHGVLQYSQGKWYPGEPLPRWAIQCYWRRDGEPVWQDAELLAADGVDYGHGYAAAERFIRSLAAQLQVDPEHAVPAYEDVVYYMWREGRLPANVDLHDNKLEDETERRRLLRVFEQGITAPVGLALPLQFQWWTPRPAWKSGRWIVRSDEMFLLPGDSAMGFRLPLKSLIHAEQPEYPTDFFPHDPLAPREPLPLHAAYARREWSGGHAELHLQPHFAAPDPRRQPRAAAATLQAGGEMQGRGSAAGSGSADGELPPWIAGPDTAFADQPSQDPGGVIRTALCVEPREGRLHVFLPPIDRLEHFLDLLAAIEATARREALPVVLEGYSPPRDYRLRHLQVAPDPGVIEVNVHPAHDWRELVEITSGVYEDAHQARLGTEKFDVDGTHCGTGGGNHLVLGGPTPADSPLLRRPDLLRSLLAYWHNHPALSYIFSGRFIGPTSQAPRVDEGRQDATYELQIAFEQVRRGDDVPPWLVDRLFRHLLVDLTGNTHRAEFCIDKLYSPDSGTGRLGLVEFRAFEMPPHARMSLTQQLLMRTLVARFWQQPYDAELVAWGTSLHDRFMLPYFIWQDLQDVLEETRQAGFDLDELWFAPHWEFRFPKIGDFTQRSVRVELRQAIEPWYVLGEEPAGGGTSRYVDSSVERLQVRVQGLTDPRHVLTCNGRRVPLHPTGVEGEYVAGVRYRAWQPPSCLHPTIPADTPLVFDLVDRWLKRSLGGCQYHVGHPGGLNPAAYPVNPYEAESRRGARFLAFGHTGGPLRVPETEPNAKFPLTLDLRRGR